MKKWVSVLLTLIFISGIIGCGKKPDSKPLSSTETEPVSSSDDSEPSHSTTQESSDSFESDNSTDESKHNETTKEYSDNTLSEQEETQVQNTAYSTQADNTGTDNMSLTSDTGAYPSVKNTTSEPRTTKGHTDGTTKKAENRTTSSKPVPPATKTQPSTTAAEETKPPLPPEKKELITVTISISCMAALNNAELKAGICPPSDGIILNSLSVRINKGSTVYDAFKKACSDSGINYEFTGTELRKNIYISSIAGLSQMDCGQYSGWKYSVNGTESSVGCSMYILSDGDTIDWHYSTTL